MLYDFGPRLLKLRKDKNLTQQMVVERAKGFDPNLRLSDSVLGKYESDLAVLNCTPFVRQYDILSNKWGVLLCQKEYQTSDIRQNSKNW